MRIGFFKRVCVPAMALVMLAVAAVAAPVSRVHDIRSPLLNAPVIVQQGKTFDILLAGNRAVGQVTLIDSQNAAAIVALTAGALSQDGSYYKTTATVPADAPEALYNLSVAFADGGTDSQPHAVKVVTGFKKKFDFVHFTDIHFNTGAPEQNEARFKLFESMMAAKPEFILFSGDLGSNPVTYDEDYPYAYEQIIAHFTAPVFMVPGNHEMYWDSNLNPPVADGLEYWNATYDRQYMSFDYGDLHVIGMNNFDWEHQYRERYNADNALFGTQGLARIQPPQWDWVKADLEAVKGRTKSTVAFMHIPLETFAGGKRIGFKDRGKISGPSMAQFTGLMNETGVSHVFVGHMHWNEEKQYGALKQVMTLTAGGGGDEKWGYRIVHVEDGRVTGWDVKQFIPSGKDLKPE